MLIKMSSSLLLTAHYTSYHGVTGFVNFNETYTETYLLIYSKAQQPLKSFGRRLMRVSLSNSILVTLTFY